MNLLPQHVAIVMDGNGRWAKQRGLVRIAGHRAGAKIVRDIVEYALELNLNTLSLFAFSLENRSRPAQEVNFLMSLFLDTLEKHIVELHKNKVRLKVFGEISSLSLKLQQKINEAEVMMASNTGLKLNIAVNYSGRWDIAQAARKVAQSVQRGLLTPDEITPETFHPFISLADCPEPDLLIRTSGEQRLSNFMLWQFAYTELFFTNTYWPDFNRSCFDEAIHFFQQRERRFGLISEQVIENDHA